MIEVSYDFVLNHVASLSIEVAWLRRENAQLQERLLLQSQVLATASAAPVNPDSCACVPSQEQQP